jgi:aspartate/methionine/tyrosine aminotransferase
MRVSAQLACPLGPIRFARLYPAPAAMAYHEGVSRFSARTGWDVAESSYAAAVREARASGRRIYDLTVSNPTRCGFSYDAQALLLPLTDARALVYDPDPRGMPSAREAVAGYYADHRAAVSPDDLVLTTSTSEGYSFLFRLLCDPGDEVLVAQPSYPLFDFLATLDDVRLRPYPLFYDHGWWIDFDRLQAAIGPRTRVILVVHPNNPTGHWTGPSERERLEELCVRHGLALIVDEVFLDYPLEASAAFPRTFAKGPHPALTFVLSGLSKIAGLPQMKAAWLLALGPDAARMSALARLEIIADTFLSMNAPVQLAIPSWLAGRGTVQAEILARARGNLAVLEGLSAASGGLEVLRAEAGWSAVLSLAGCVGERECAERLVRERGVVVHPGGFYGMAERQRVVVSLIGSTAEMEEGIQAAIR